MTAAVGTELELRCPFPVGDDPEGKLLGKTLPASDDADTAGLVELSCPSCVRTSRTNGDPVLRVLHRFNLLGEHMETESIVSG